MSEADFESILNSYAGRQVTLVKNTITFSNQSGSRIEVEGTPSQVKAYVVRYNANFTYDKAGFIHAGQAVGLFLPTTNPAVDDFVYTDGLYFTISNIDGDATTITVATSSAHGLAVGNSVIITGTTNYNGVYVVATVPDTTHFTIADTSHNLAAETSGYIQRSFNKYRIKELLKVPGVFDATGPTTSFAYFACNLFLENAY